MPNELTRFQQDIENKAVAAEQKRLELVRQIEGYEAQLKEMFHACDWLDRDRVLNRAKKRVDEDEESRGKIRGGVHV